MLSPNHILVFPRNVLLLLPLNGASHQHKCCYTRSGMAAANPIQFSRARCINQTHGLPVPRNRDTWHRVTLGAPCYLTPWRLTFIDQNFDPGKARALVQMPRIFLQELNSRTLLEEDLQEILKYLLRRIAMASNLLAVASNLKNG